MQAWVCLALGTLMVSCGEAPAPKIRGYILISVDTLRADHLGAYGFHRDSSPFIDSLAQRGVLFEHAYAQIPGTLPSHMSMLTGLYPGEHGVYPPTGVLPDALETVPEVFQRHGFRTAGHTEGGYVHGGYGFARGFDQWSHEAEELADDVSRTLQRGLGFLRELTADEPFFLFLHTYAVHDPYHPPAEHLARFWEGEPPPGTFDPTGPNLSAFNRGELELSAQGLDYFRAAYAASIHYVDSLLRDFYQELELLGLADQTVLILTSDHGEEFREHGKLVHEQIYVESLHVPLLFVGPGLQPRRLRGVVELVDLAPTLYDLAGLQPELTASGTSLAGLLRGAPEVAGGQAFAEGFVGYTRSLIGTLDSELTRSGPAEDAETAAGPTGAAGSGPRASDAHALADARSGSPVYQMFMEQPVWVLDNQALEFDYDPADGPLRMRGLAFREARELSISLMPLDGSSAASSADNGSGTDQITDLGEQPQLTVSLSPDRWTEIEVPVPPGSAAMRVRAQADGCVRSPTDPYCLSFRLLGRPLMRLQLFDLDADPLAQNDLAPEQRRVLRSLLPRLEAQQHHRRAQPDQKSLDPELEARLRALGYL